MRHQVRSKGPLARSRVLMMTSAFALVAAAGAVSAPASETFTIQIEINPEQIVVSDVHGKILDQYARPNRGAPLGQFGFKGEVELVVQRAQER